MDLLRLIVVHVLIGTSVALGMALVPLLVWLVQHVARGEVVRSKKPREGIPWA